MLSEASAAIRVGRKVELEGDAGDELSAARLSMIRWYAGERFSAGDGASVLKVSAMSCLYPSASAPPARGVICWLVFLPASGSKSKTGARRSRAWRFVRQVDL